MTKKDDVVIKLEDVWKIYKIGDNEINALAGVDIEIPRGKFVVIMGPSGSGKSTCVNMVGCLDIPTKGEIYLNGDNIAHLGESELAQIRGKTIGFIFQQFNLIPTLTALQNVMLPMAFQDMDVGEREERAKELLTMVELGDRMNNRPTELSGGQQQRVAIARALANDPDVILADEPTGNLDSRTGIIVMEYLQKLHNQGKTIIMVTHDPKMTKFAERVVLLKDGKTVKKL
ncbi:ABC transporter ATP-binding protein [Candidatus Woesearchaeota archaeon]|nr:ABC transporter ATP-binding protein [Candidatus Woesearchaeota archaeon]